MQSECLWYTHSSRLFSKKYHFALMIKENCKISTAHIVKLDKSLIDSNIITAIKKEFFNQNEKCEFSFTIYTGYPEELRKAIEKCQSYLLSDSLKLLSNTKNSKTEKTEDTETIIKLKNNKGLTTLSRLNGKNINTQSIDNEANAKTTTSIFSTIISQANLSGEHNLEIQKTSSLKLIDVQQYNNMTLLAKKCYNLRFSPDYRECLNIHYKCHFYAYDREKLKECRIKNGIIGLNIA